MSKAVKGTNSVTPSRETSLLGVVSAVLPAPEIKGTDAEPGAGSNRRTGRALDTPKRGWRWMLISSLLFLLPYSVSAIQDRENSGLDN